MGTEIVPVNKSELPIRRDEENKPQDWRPSQSLSGFIADSFEIYRIRRGLKSSIEKPPQVDFQDLSAKQEFEERNEVHLLGGLGRSGFKENDTVEHSDQLGLEPNKLGFIPQSTEIGLPEPMQIDIPDTPLQDQPSDLFSRDAGEVFSKNGTIFQNSSENVEDNESFQSMELKGDLFQDSKSDESRSRLERSFDGTGGLEALVDTLASNFPEELADPLKSSNFEVELVSKGKTFTITPLKLEPLTFEDAVEAPIDVKVNLLVKGAALLEKRKNEPPPLTTRESREIEKRKGLILRAIDDIVERGADRAGKLVADRWGRRGLSFVGAAGLAISASACASDSQEIAPSLLPVEPVPTETFESPTLVPESSAVSILAFPESPYPTSDNGFILGAGGQDVAENRVRDLGAGGDIEKMKGMLIAEMNRTGINLETIEWEFAINEQAENPSWTMWAKDRVSGQFLLPKLTSGPDAGQLIRSGNLFAYLDREIGDDFFDLVELQNPQGLASAEQRIISDSTGWFVPGGFTTEGEMLEWFSVDKDEWISNSELAEGAESQVVLEQKVLPTTCLDPELQGSVIENFLETAGYETLQDLYDTVWDSDKNESRDKEYFRPSATWSGLESYTSKWTHGRDLLLLGTARISIANLPGANAEDFVQCVFLGDPRMPNKLVPVVLSVQRKNVWATTTIITSSDNFPESPQRFDDPPVQTQDDLDNWVTRNAGYPIVVNLLMRFRSEGDWSTIQSNTPLIDPPSVVKDVMTVMDEQVYFKYYTRNPEELGPPMWPRPDGSVVGEFANLRVVLDNLDPAVDIGLFPDIFHLPTDRFP